MTPIEINYNAGRKVSTYEHDELTFDDFPQYELRFSVAIVRRYRFSHYLFDELLSLHKEQFSGARLGSVMAPGPENAYLLAAKPNKTDKYKYSSESLVFQIRRTLDSIVQYASLIADQPSNDTGMPKIQLSGIDGLLKDGGNETKIFRILFAQQTLEETDTTGYLKIINDIFNAMKHHWFHEESLNNYCEEWPTIFTYYAKNNSPEKHGLFLHNHNCFHLMMGFQDIVRLFLGNLKGSFEDKSA